MPAKTLPPSDAASVARRTAQRAEFASAPSDALFDVGTVAVVVSTTAKTLETWRSTGRGPAVTRIGSRAIRYRKRDVETWLSRADAMPAAPPKPTPAPVAPKLRRPTGLRRIVAKRPGAK